MAVFVRPLRRTGPGGRQTVPNVRANATRMAAVVTPLVRLTGMTCTVLFTVLFVQCGPR